MYWTCIISEYLELFPIDMVGSIIHICPLWLSCIIIKIQYIIVHQGFKKTRGAFTYYIQGRQIRGCHRCMCTCGFYSPPRNHTCICASLFVFLPEDLYIGASLLFSPIWRQWTWANQVKKLKYFIKASWILVYDYFLAGAFFA